jgi:hypothetical protein
MGTAWSISGEYVEACSCAFLCPCITSNATAPATEDFCRFAMTYRIDTGKFGATDLGGVTFAVVAESKAIMSQGGWIMGVIIDERATPEQANAVAQIAGGQAGGPMAAFAPLVGEFRGIERHPIRFEISGNRRTATIPGVLEDAVEGVPSVAVSGECLAIDNTFHPANKRLNLATAAKHLIACFGIRWDDSSNRRNGHFAPFAWRGSA